jgi:transposase-like protein
MRVVARTRSEWERLVADFRDSGLKQKDFCRSRGVAVSTLQYWIRRLRSDGKKLQVVPVRVVHRDGARQAELEAHIGPVALRFSSEVPAAYAVALLRGLAESC